MIANFFCISFLVLSVFITKNYPVNEKNIGNAVNRESTDVRVNDGRGGKPYGGCGYYNLFCYGK